MSESTEVIVVPEIHCDHCKSSIEGALAPLDGVSKAVVDVDATNVTVAFDADLIGRERLVEEIEAQGYEVPQ